MHYTSHHCQVIKNIQHLTQRFFIFIKTFKILTMTLVKCTVSQIDVLSPDVLSLRTFCPHGSFVCWPFCPTDVMSLAVMSPDILSLRMFYLSGCFISPDVLSLWTFCLSGRFVSPYVSSLRTFRLSVRFVSPDV